jgi:hypothetical protein
MKKMPAQNVQRVKTTLRGDHLLNNGLHNQPLTTRFSGFHPFGGCISVFSTFIVCQGAFFDGFSDLRHESKRKTQRRDDCTSHPYDNISTNANSRGQQTLGHDSFQANASPTTTFFDIHPSGTAALLKQVVATICSLLMSRRTAERR